MAELCFSVIIPFLNEERYIERCIKSLLDQDFDRSAYEVIFVNNGSTDSSPEIVRKYKDIIFLEEKKSGAYSARNKGLEIARGEIIAFTDADCEVSRDWLTQIDRGMKEAGASIVLGSRHFPSSSSKLLKMAEYYESAKIEYILGNSLQNNYFGYTNNMAVRADIFKEIGVFADLKRGADTEYVHRCISKVPGAKVVYLPEMRITHLEITDLGKWLKKQYIYGGNSARLRETKSYGVLSATMRVKIFNYNSAKRNYGFSEKLICFFLLIVGLLFFTSGRIKVKLWG